MEKIVRMELHKHKFRQRALEKLMNKLIKELKDDPMREGLIDTPLRVVGLITKYLDGQRFSNSEIAKMFNYTSTVKGCGVIEVKGIKAITVSELTLIPYNIEVDIAYKPNKLVLGTSKIHKLVDLCSKRLRIQENIAQDIYDVLYGILNTKDISIKILGHQIDGDVYTELKRGIFER